MNIIVWTRRGASRQFNLASPGNLSLILLGFLAIAGALFLAAFLTAQAYFAEAPDERAQRLQAELDQQRTRVQILESESERKIAALNARLGDMQAEVTRLNALGERLTQMAGLEEGEFNFGSVPALGGPEEAIEDGLDLSGGPDLGVEERARDLQNQLTDRNRQLGVLENLLRNRTVRDRVQPQGRPIEGGWVSSGYGSRTDPFSGRRAWHGGMDFAGSEGSDVFAVAAGVVTWSGRRYGYGNLVEINHGNGYSTRYAHNQENLVSVGQRVEKGDLIALLGQSGRATGPHVHFEVHQNGRTVNPSDYIRSGD